MKNVELSDEAYDKLLRLAAAKQLSPEETLAALLNAESAACDAQLLYQLTAGDIARAAEPDERYLALLAWVARQHAADFAGFVSHQESARRYLLLSRHEVINLRQQHQSRQIDGTHYWAIMNIAADTKAAFVRRLLEYVGCHDGTIDRTLDVLDLEKVKLHRTPELIGID